MLKTLLFSQIQVTTTSLPSLVLMDTWDLRQHKLTRQRDISLLIHGYFDVIPNLREFLSELGRDGMAAMHQFSFLVSEGAGQELQVTIKLVTHDMNKLQFQLQHPPLSFNRLFPSITWSQTAEYGKCTPEILFLKLHCTPEKRRGTIEFGCGSIVWSFYFATVTTEWRTSKEMTESLEYYMMNLWTYYSCCICHRKQSCLDNWDLGIIVISLWMPVKFRVQSNFRPKPFLPECRTEKPLNSLVNFRNNYYLFC